MKNFHRREAEDTEKRFLGKMDSEQVNFGELPRALLICFVNSAHLLCKTNIRFLWKLTEVHNFTMNGLLDIEKIRQIIIIKIFIIIGLFRCACAYL